MSQRTLAKKAGTSQKSIDNWERGVSSPSAVALCRLADIFECSTDYLIGREDDLGNVTLSVDLETKEQELLHFLERATKNKRTRFYLTSSIFLKNRNQPKTKRLRIS